MVGRNLSPSIKAELERVPSVDPAHVVHDLVRVLNPVLGRVGIWSDIETKVPIKRDIRKPIQTWKRKARVRVILLETIEADAPFVREVCRKRVVVGCCKEVE